jgi:hypothetical protein
MFYICWGTKSYLRLEGIAADFCPMCRRPAAVEVSQILTQNHIYHIGIGKGQLVGRQCRCLTCSSDWPLQAGTIQTSVIPAGPNIPLSLETLISETFPRFSLVHGERLAQEAVLAQDPFALDEQTRANLIAEPFFLLDNDVRHGVDTINTWQRNLSTFTFVSAILCALSALIAFAIAEPLWGWSWVVLTVGLAWSTRRLLSASSARFMRESIYPRIASCLAPLCPTSEEMAGVLGQIRGQSKCASSTVLKDLLPLLYAPLSHGERAPAAAR